MSNDLHKVIARVDLSPTTYVLRVEKNDRTYQSGQYMTLGMPDSMEMREYSVYSGASESYLEFLVKEVVDGDVSKELRTLKAGDNVRIDGPFGFFTLSDDEVENTNYLFIASGTGVSPFHSFIKTYPNLNYQLLHGVRNIKEAFGSEDYMSDRYVLCTSRDQKGDFYGRVTEYMETLQFDKNIKCYLCGNSNMIYDAFDILKNKGIPSEQLYMEVYF